MNQFCEITPELRRLAAKSAECSKIDPELYTRYDVKRGLRDLNGKGVLVGLTEISEVSSTKIVNGESVPADGELFYRGYNVKDLIAGLPGDTVEGFTRSLEQAIALDPENITVHTLTLKRASDLVVEHRAAAYDDVAAMLERCVALQQAGYRPYYLYRQKGTLQNLENIGWAKPGRECLYNIYIMEEVHTILSAGAGGSTKLVIPGKRHGKIERIFNFKYPTEYIDRFQEILARKQGVEDFYERCTTQTLCQP